MIKGKIKAISISGKKGVPKSNVPKAKLIENHGIEGDAHAGDWSRQVSILAMESVNKMKAKGLDAISPGDFAENLTTEFIDVPNLKIGVKVKIGQAILEITQIGKECRHDCAIYQKVGDCIMPREGVFAKTLAGGEIAVGDEIEIV